MDRDISKDLKEVLAYVLDQREFEDLLEHVGVDTASGLTDEELDEWRGLAEISDPTQEQEDRLEALTTKVTSNPNENHVYARADRVYRALFSYHPPESLK